MSTVIKSILQNSKANLVSDMIGALSLVVILVGGLHLPGLF